MKLDPVAPGRITADGGITTEVLFHLSPSGPRDPQVDHSRRLYVGNLPARGVGARGRPTDILSYRLTIFHGFSFTGVLGYG